MSKSNIETQKNWNDFFDEFNHESPRGCPICLND